MPSGMSLRPALTADEYAHWLPPDEASKILVAKFGDSYVARHTLLERIRGGKVRAVDQDLKEVDAQYWRAVGEDDQFWITGDLTLRVRDDVGYSSDLRFYHVRFDPNAVSAVIPPHLNKPGGVEEAPRNNPAIAANKGGRPPKSWWQDLWVEMCCQVYEGDIHPTATQADIFARMQQWVSDHDHDAGETVLKEAARKLSVALKARSET